ncbi:hypothetical protein BMG03_20115 (plasmid) [Thioclava nitratireducens]|uniref:DUF1232 domain-containing protein n=1 Tax=Thioclava nitratireducens TaxID=1915078 RepID=A0ABM6IMS9_9RHOB|nr:YkvA family protein [Thioclava nitratireducens]AQS50218.1 hypothetical protein BMG03_20115 [Thioclava nitratireducens]
MQSRVRQWAQTVKRDTVCLYLAARDPRTPWYAKALAASVVAYALSPIDLIPDFIPIIGFLDDILLVPLGLWIAMRMVPDDVIEDCRVQATQLTERPTSKTAALVIPAIWMGAAAAIGWVIYEAIAS